MNRTKYFLARITILILAMLMVFSVMAQDDSVMTQAEVDQINAALDFWVGMWQGQGFEGIENYFADVTTVRFIFEHVSFGYSHDSFNNWISFNRGLFPDLQFTVLNQAIGDEWVAQQFLYEGTHTGYARELSPTGNPISTEGMVFIRFEDGRIVELQLLFDGIVFETTIGRINPLLPVATQSLYTELVDALDYVAAVNGSAKAGNAPHQEWGTYDTFLNLVAGSPELAEMLSGTDEFTIFVPNDAAFEMLPEGLLDDAEAVNNLLMGHIVEGKNAPEVLDPVTALNGDEIMRDLGGLVTFNEGAATLIQGTISVQNGWVIFIDGVLQPVG